MQRLLVGEQLRRSYNTDQKVLQHSGVLFAYRRLSDAHPVYKKEEICEFLARQETVSPTRLQAAGFLPDAIDTRGLYTIQQAPGYPHPFCKCYLEPLAMDPTIRDPNWHPVEKGPGYERSTEGVYGALRSNLTPSQQALVAPQTRSLNAAATSNGLVGVAFTTADVATLGVEGCSAILAQRLRDEHGVAKSREMVRKVIDDVLPLQATMLDEARTRRDRLVSRVEQDRATILSEATSARQIERTNRQYRDELQQAHANVSVLRSLESAIRQRHGSGFATAVATSEAEITRRMRALGQRRSNYSVEQVSDGHYRAVVKDSRLLMEHYVRQTETNDRARAIKDAMQPGGDRSVVEIPPRGVRAVLPGGHRFTLDRIEGQPPAQQAAIRLIEAQKSVLVNYAPGLGKTPLVIASVSDLHAQGRIQNAVISPPSSVRAQMVVETIKFNDAGRVSYYVPNSQVSTQRTSLRESLLGDYESSHSVGRRARSGETLSTSDRTEYRRIQREAKAYADAGMARIDVVGVSGRDAQTRFRDHMADTGSGNLFHVMGHDDLARLAPVMNEHVDYVAIDEIHQMTSQSLAATTRKAQALDQLTGGRIEYRVGLSGTPVRNNLGELHDELRWIRPDMVPDKDEYQRQYGNITLQSDAFRDSTVRQLRRSVDSNIITVGSPVQSELRSAFSERISGEQREQMIRRLDMTEPQQTRARSIESEYNRVKTKQNSMRDSGEITGARMRLTDSRRELDVLVSDSLGVSVGRYRSHMEEFGVPPAPQGSSSPSRQQLGRIRSLQREVEGLTQVVMPETWRDNAHHSNVHGGDWRENAKAIETVRLFNTPAAEGGLQGRPTLIHLERYESVDMLTAALREQGLRVGDYHGGLGPAERARRVSSMNDGNLDVLILTRAGSTGLNVQQSSDATIHFDLPYTFAEVEQRDARNWRNGQRNDVDSHTLLQQDMYTDRRRLQVVQEKKAVLRAVDEIVRVDDSVDPMFIHRQADGASVMSYDAMEQRYGTDQTRSMLQDICGRLATVGATGPCAVRPAKMSTTARRNDPVMGEVPREQRASLREVSDGEDSG
jgi:hypothetical protein